MQFLKLFGSILSIFVAITNVSAQDNYMSFNRTTLLESGSKIGPSVDNSKFYLSEGQVIIENHSGDAATIYKVLYYSEATKFYILLDETSGNKYELKVIKSDNGLFEIYYSPNEEIKSWISIYSVAPFK